MEKNRIGNQIRYWRKTRGLSQQELAEKIGSPTKAGQVNLSMIEAGNRVPELGSTLPKICEALGLDFDVILYDRETGRHI